MARNSGLMLVSILLILIFSGCGARKSTFDSSPPAPTPETTTPPSSASAAPAVRPLQSEGFGESSLLAEGSENTRQAEMPGDQASPLATVFFEYDSAALGDDTLRTIEANARWLNAHPRTRVVIEGHCDERGTLEYNLGLGARRAATVRDHLVRLGIAPDRLETISFGEEKPAEEGHDEAAWAKNRRAEFRVEEP